MWWLLLLLITHIHTFTQRTLHFYKLIDFYIIFWVLLTFCAHFFVVVVGVLSVYYCSASFGHDSDVSLT